MPRFTKRNHIASIQRFSRTEPYVYPRPAGGGKLTLNSTKSRAGHAARLKDQLNAIKLRFNLPEIADIDEGLSKDEIVYVEFYSDWGYKFDFDQFNSNRPNPQFQLISVKKESSGDEEMLERYRLLVALSEGGVSTFLKKVEEFETSRVTGNNPRHAKLLFNIDDIRLATLEAFWTDAQFHDFPSTGDSVWWEVWFRKSRYIGNEEKIASQLLAVGATIGVNELVFVEHVVKLVRASPDQLSNSLMLLDCLAELRKPQELNDFITSESQDFDNEQEWAADLRSRLKLEIDKNSVLICLLDSGVNHRHELLRDIIPEENLYSWKAGWGLGDTERGAGHGTGMAGLAIFGDLTEVLAGNEIIEIRHGVESFKILHPSSSTNPELYGVVYKDGCNSPFIDRPQNKRVYCISITNSGIIKSGRPSSSSAALDDITFGNLHESAEKQLVIASSGNIALVRHDDYPTLNFEETIQDPGQAYNVITVGGFTLKFQTSEGRLAPLARRGAMAPCNSASAVWEKQWANKPDIVMEAGNMLTDGVFVEAHPELDPLSLDKDFTNNLFVPFGGTSAAAALASKMAARLMTLYPNYRPETIRGLIIHSATWTEAMISGVDLNNEQERIKLLCSVGYGVPNIEKAMYSANNCLTIISENELSPYRLEGSDVKYNEYHLYELPWPIDVLRNIVAENDVCITVTLSYFIEPNPGARQYVKSFSYHSHNLDFKLIKPTEDLPAFKRRISAASTGDESSDLYEGTSENWTIKERVRSKGSVKKDFLNTNGADLSTRRYLAVYPKNGWYRTRKALKKYDSQVRYSLIVTIETRDLETDIFTPVEIQVAIPIAL